MIDFSDCLAQLANIAPLELAEDWDNVGLLIDRTAETVSTVMTCLTLTPDVSAEAIDKQVDLVVSHHPVMFQPRQQLTYESLEGGMLLQLIQADIAVYSPHTAYDSAAQGINSQLAELLELSDVQPIRPWEASLSDKHPPLKGLGAGRIGRLAQPISLREFSQRVESMLPTAAGLQYVGDAELPVSTVAVACGAAAEFQRDARKLGADVLLTGEARFHACLEARGTGMGLIIAGHYATERHAVERLAHLIMDACSGITAFASDVESDPLTLVSR